MPALVHQTIKAGQQKPPWICDLFHDGPSGKHQEGQRLEDRTPMTRTTTQESQRKHWGQWQPLCAPCSSHESLRISWICWEWTITLFCFLGRTIGPFWWWHLSGCGCKHEWWTVPIHDHNFSYCGALLSFWRPLSKFLPVQSCLFTERTQI